MILDFDLDIPCKTSTRWCSRGSPGGCSENIKMPLENKYQRKIHRKN